MDSPPRPENVPGDARFIASPIPHWEHGRRELRSGQPLGPQVYYTVHGEPMRYERYDEQGRLLSRRSSMQLDWMDVHVDRFREETDRFDWHPFAGRFDDATRAKIRDIAVAGSAAHRLSYAQALAFLDQRRARTATLGFPRADLVLELFRAAPPAADRELDDPDAWAFVGLALDAMLTLGDRAGVAAWGPRWLDATRAARAGDRLPERLAERVRAALRGRWDDGILARATRELGVVLRPVLGVPGVTALLLIDPAERAYWLDADGVRPAPLEVDATGPSLSRWFAEAPARSRRELTAADGRGYWLCQRYGRDLFFFGGARDVTTLSLEPVVDVFVRCPDDTWAGRVADLFAVSRPFPAAPTDGFEDGDAVWLREYRGDVDHLSARDVRWLGVVGNALVSAVTPRPKQSLFEPREKSRPPTLERRATTDRTAAIAAFDAEERSLFEHGYVLAALHRHPWITAEARA